MHALKYTREIRKGTQIKAVSWPANANARNTRR